MNKKIAVEAQIMRVSSLMDGSASLSIHTKEIPDVEFTILRSFHGKTGWLLFKEDEVQEIDIPKGNSTYEGKTPSQRLRNTLFVYWKQLGEKEDFETFYRRQMDLIINYLQREKLDRS